MPYQVGVTRIAILVALLAPPMLRAQVVRWTIESKTSLARWEMAPHSNQLRATTCPEDPTWTPGEGSDHGMTLMDAVRGVSRARVRPVCAEALTGDLSAADTIRWSDVRGTIVLRADQLVTGLKMRDQYARSSVLETARFPEIRFTIDSLAGVQPGDTLRGYAGGVFELRGVRRPMNVPITWWRDRGGLRVIAQFTIPAKDLLETYRMSGGAIGMAVKQGVWKSLEVAVDVVLRDVPQGPVTAVR